MAAAACGVCTILILLTLETRALCLKVLCVLVALLFKDNSHSFEKPRVSRVIIRVIKRLRCHGTTSLPLLHPPLAASEPFHLCSAPPTSTLLQLRSMLA